ncbi:Cytochrome P450 26C1 [Acipenser ruthenus]|uniref:Cytochrome P450 26C1 n=1 Tax=Acipenser ruthenus TaxID=7906 RepID=A0A662Z030_ACIRT|nr:Cytochrome P450 26C1 [Acipenser ruthenus]
MFLLEVSYFMVLSTAFTSIISVLLLLAVSRQLWSFRWRMTKDRTCKLPLPNGSMGWPLFGETFHWLLQGSSFHISRREKYGNVFRTHVLGKPVIRVTGAENIRKILLGEHNLILAKVFSHAALETYIPRIQSVVRTEVESWCVNQGSINVYPSAKALTFRIAVRVLLGLSVEDDYLDYLSKTFEQLMENLFSLPLDVPFSGLRKSVVRTEVESWCVNQGSINVYPSAKALTFRIAVRVLLGLSVEDDYLDYLSKTFEQLMENLFSLPLDVPFSGLRKGIKARDILHECMEKTIAEKLKQSQSKEYSDALDYMLSSAKENGNELNIKELKESAVELIFAAYSTTASASTSLILQLMRHPSVAEKAKQELVSQGLNGHRAHFKSCKDGNSLPIFPEASAEKRGTHEESNSTTKTKPQKGFELTHHTTSGPPCTMPATVEEGHYSCHQPYLSLEKLSQLHYLDCVVKEVLRTLPPVSGGYRTALQTFELDGYQIPKGWSVMYSIRDTHETAAVYQSPELFDPDRFGTEREEGKAGRFNFIPFGGGIRSCIGRKLAQIILKIIVVELLNTARWELATPTYPKMQTVPIVHPVNGLHVCFNYLNSHEESNVSQKL